MFKWQLISWFGFLAYRTIDSLSIAKSCCFIYIYILNICFVNIFCRYIQLNNQTVLFLTIQFSLSQISLMVPSIVMYNSIKQSFVYKHLNDQTVLFQTIQFSISHLFALSLNVKTVLFGP